MACDSCSPTPVPLVNPCPPSMSPLCTCNYQTDASCVFYNSCGTLSPNMPCTNIPSGTSLNIILEKLDAKICSIAPVSFTGFNLGCFRPNYVIDTVQQFAEAVTNEYCFLKTGQTSIISDYTTQITNLAARVSVLEVPNLIDNCSFGFLPTDTLKQTLQKIANQICTFSNVIDLSPVLAATNTPTISFVTSGIKNHTISANVNLSSTAGNYITKDATGIYAPTPAAQVAQTLSINTVARTITLSGGGGTITLPPDLDNQTLSLVVSTKQLTISGGNTVDLSPLFAAIVVTQTPITPVNTSSVNITATGTDSHTISATVNIDGTVTNALKQNATGLFVAPEAVLIPTDSSTLHFVASGIDGHSLTGNVKLSVTAGNIIVANTDGLFAPTFVETNLTVTDSSTLHLVASGVDGHALTGNVKLSATAGNAITANADGIYAPTSTFTSVTTANTSSVNLSGNGLSGTPLSAAVKISASAGNVAVINADGVFVPTPTAYTSNNGITLTGSNFQLGGSLIQNTTITTAAFNLTGSGVASSINSNVYPIGGVVSFTSSGAETNQYVIAGIAPALAYSSTAGTFTPNTKSKHGALSATNFINGTTATWSGVLPTIFSCFEVAGSNSVTTAACYRALTPYQSAGQTAYTGTITNAVGLYIDDFGLTDVSTHITNRFAIYQVGTTDVSRFFGPVQNAAGAVQFTSDVRVKENILPFTRGLAEIDLIDTKSFNYTYNKNSKVVGIIAQELEKIIPEAVSQGNFDVPNGEHYSDFRMVDQTVLFYSMLNAIKELSNNHKALQSAYDAYVKLHP